MFIEQNIKGICDKFGMDYIQFLEDMEVDSVHELTLLDLEAIADEYNCDLFSLLFVHTFKSSAISEKLSKIKLLVIDIDGVMTDGGMYFTENGDQIKKFNTKDGLAIIELTKKDFQVAIISSGFTGAAVNKRAEMLGVQYCHVGRENKIDILDAHMKNLGIDYENVALIGDDVNDLGMMKKIGLAVCPKDAVPVIKSACHIVLNLEGGRGCVREFIDNYLLEKPVT